ncbi:Sgn1p KNAG_0G01000 [Huiozyma naganishii CBS 8797]|uniref:RRM domain-containing protein n=1 Tax=Huiozyma naganishii (strain ATCC MYA-139 / BCRC 22969 / CBS 8797 / KCTC 17520 / NBRC 10181 / NCYC 3082 / Yp74L-3) TaxID=1071383 RepID=J7RNL9_HUIN7|nr:hypothetical protein KNAG_0G01000 [Kazachstania naganishii CBS 8797]CCK71158.1 hypothetical protein KNAG_0G01000 [Kazachstania naganishii CBS 8797]
MPKSQNGTGSDLPDTLQFKISNFATANNQSLAIQRAEADTRSIFVRGLSPETGPEVIEDHFKACGPISRITLFSQKRKRNTIGYAYIEFEAVQGRANALDLNNSILNGYSITVKKKRTNVKSNDRKELQQG